MGSFLNYQYIFWKTLHEGKYFQWIQEMFLKVKCIPMWQGSTFSQGTEHTIQCLNSDVQQIQVPNGQ